MSRIGKMPIALPAKVTVSVDKGNLVTVSGPKGTLKQQFDPDMTIDVEGNEVKVLRPTDQREHRAQHGLTRALLANMVQGVDPVSYTHLDVYKRQGRAPRRSFRSL